MITKVIQLIRHAPLELLEEYFSFLPSTTKLEWSSSNQQVLKPILQIIDQLEAHNKENIANDVERILAITDESGQAALSSVIKDLKIFHPIKNIYQRSLWAFLYNHESFVKAEKIRHADFNLKDTSWDGFIGTKNINLSNSSERMLLFENEIKNIFNIEENIKVEILSRYLADDILHDYKTFQIIIHYNIAPTSYLTFEAGEIVRDS